MAFTANPELAVVSRYAGAANTKSAVAGFSTNPELSAADRYIGAAVEGEKAGSVLDKSQLAAAWRYQLTFSNPYNSKHSPPTPSLSAALRFALMGK